MATPTFNAGKDYAGLSTATGGAFAVKSSAEGRSNQSAEGTNGKGDVAALDIYGSTADPTAEYELIDAIEDSSLIALGMVSSHDDFANPLMLTGITINTSAKAAPTSSVTMKMIEPGGVTKRIYQLPSTIVVNATPRHRAQDILGALTIKKKVNNAWVAVTDDTEADITTANFAFTVEPTIGQPKGVTSSSDCSNGKVVATYTVGVWIAEPIDFTAATGFAITAEKTRTDPENGYSEYAVTLTHHLVGSEYVAPDGE